MTDQPQESEWLIDDILPRQEISLFAGPSGSNKTTWLFQLIQDWQAGRPIFSHVSHPESYVYVSIDRSLRSVHRTLRRMKLNPDDYPIFSAVDEGLCTLGTILSRIKELFPDAKTMFLDGFATLAPDGKVSDYGNVAGFLSRVTRICTKDGYTLLGIVHASKTKENEKYLNPRERVLGSVAWAGFSETIFYIEPLSPDKVTENIRRLEILPRNAPNESYEMELNNIGILVPSTREHKQTERWSGYLDTLPNEGEFTSQDFQFGTGISRAHTYRILQDLCDSLIITRVSKGSYKKNWLA